MTRMNKTSSQTASSETSLSPLGRILIVDDEEVIASTLQEFLQEEGFEVAAAANAQEALDLLGKFEPEIVLCDVQLPGLDGLDLLDRVLHVRPETLVMMITAFATVENAVAAFRRGAQDYLMKPVLFDELLAKIERLMGFRRLLHQNQALRRQLHRESNGLGGMIGNSPVMLEIKSLLHKVGPTRSNVLISGESGTGKELVARALHTLGLEPEEPFVAVNCAAIPLELLESQLFGHLRGSFTGADRDQAGLFAAAGRGTVFLDEIGEMPSATQAKLLRAIENKEIWPVGATRSRPLKARIVAATNKDLPTEVAAGRFRADLFYRLNVVHIRMPSLRNRTEDIPQLVGYLLTRHARSLGKPINGVDNETMKRLTSASWKGNIRELDNALERAAILADSTLLTPEDFPREWLSETDYSTESADDLRAFLAQAELTHIRRVLARCNGDKREAARKLGLGLSSLYRKLEDDQSSENP